jgi:hypothetical protein
MDSEKTNPHQTPTSYSNPEFKRPSRTNNTCWRRHIVKTLAENRIKGHHALFCAEFYKEQSLQRGRKSLEKYTLKIG